MIEFALILPVLAALIVCGMEVSRMVQLSQKVDRLTTSVSDLIAQAEVLTETEINNVFAASSQIMVPFPITGNGRTIVTAIWRNAGNQIRVCWQRSFPTTGPGTSAFGSPGQTVTALPAGMTVRSNETIIVAETFYTYAPTFWQQLATTNYYRVSYSRPRIANVLTIGSTPCNASTN